MALPGLHNQFNTLLQCNSSVNCILGQCIVEQCFVLAWRTFPVESTLQSVEDGCGLTLASNHAILLFECQILK